MLEFPIARDGVIRMLELFCRPLSAASCTQIASNLLRNSVESRPDDLCGVVGPGECAGFDPRSVSADTFGLVES